MTSIIQTVKPDFDKVLAYSQNIGNPHTTKLLNAWYEAKKDIIDAWGGKLIVETEQNVTFDLSEEEKTKRLDDFISSIDLTYNNEDLMAFLDEVRADFFTNILSKEYSAPGIQISKGTKIIKAFKYFEHNEKALKDLQNQASMIIQEDKINGILCLSVHPLDYLSSSENTYHWRSCHALDGDYRAGNLSYMMDRSTIVTYLKKPGELCKLPNFPEDVLWNSKKWRMLLFLEDEREALFAGRQYPFFSNTALSHVSQLFFANFSKDCYFWSKWYNDYLTEFPRAVAAPARDINVSFGRNIMMGGRVYAMNDLITDVKGSQHFDDLIFSSCYVPYYCWRYYPKNNRRLLHFTLGAPVPCIRCEDNHVDFDASMICLECEAEVGEGENDYFTYCACCERRVPREYTRWVESADGYLCPSCVETETRECEHCGSAWYTCDITYSHKSEQYLCPYCAESENRNKLIASTFRPVPFVFDDEDLPF